MKIIGSILHWTILMVTAINTQSQAYEIKWSLDFLMVDETGQPLSGVKIEIAYLDTSKPGAVTLTNWASHMSHTNMVTDKQGKGMVSGTGTPDAWQCHFSKTGYQRKFRMYSGPSNLTGFSGPGSASQKHTEMLVSSNASPGAYPRWKMTIKAVDSLGSPIEGATAKVYYHLDRVATGLTDSKGLFSFSETIGSWDIRLDVLKTGCYNASKIIHLNDRETYTPEKWNQTVTLQLNRIDSIPMYAKREETKIQKENEPIGFDLMAGDWVTPYGAGTNADLLFAVKRKIISQREYNAELKLSFPNPGDGIAVMPPAPDSGSAFSSPHSAFESGYQPERVWHYSPSQKLEPVQGYFFRVRTVLDESGKVKTALYGKIQGDFRFYAGTKAPQAGMGFNYYLNPTTNSLNVEFDPKQNLMKKLSFLEDVKEP